MRRRPSAYSAGATQQNKRVRFRHGRWQQRHRSLRVNSSRTTRSRRCPTATSRSLIWAQDQTRSAPAAPRCCAMPSSRRRAPAFTHARCRGRGALRRQGKEHQEAHCLLYAADRPRHAHRKGDRTDRQGRVRHHRDRDGSAAARSQPDQAAAAAVQRSAP